MANTEELRHTPLGVAADVCPDGTPWCRRHESDADRHGWCNSRGIEIPFGDTTALLEVSNGMRDGTMSFVGLCDLPLAVDLDTARRVAASVIELLEEIGR